MNGMPYYDHQDRARGINSPTDVEALSHPTRAERELGRSSNLKIIHRASDEECRRRLRESWVVFLPNSFSEEVRVMVSTSFPSKLAESLPAGRPMLVFGPEYAALPRYFKENQIPLCATSVGEVETALRKIEELDTPGLIQRYQGLIDRFHSPEKLRQILGGANEAEIAPRQDVPVISGKT